MRILLLCCILSAPVLAQSFDPLRYSFLPRVEVFRVGMTAADLDGDGDVDFAVCGIALQNQLLINDGEGRFTSVFVPWSLGLAEATSVAAADLDGDGDAELMMGTTLDPTGTMDILLRNDGNLTFTMVPWGGNVADRTVQIVTVDIDGDGDLDVLNRNLFPNYSCPSCNRPPSLLFRNDGLGQLSVAALFPQPPWPARPWDADVIDFDGDGHLDILFGGTVPQLYRGLGSAAFATTPITLSGMEYNFVADLDGDGDDDLVTTMSQVPSVRRNDGNGVFTTLPLPVALGTPVAAADLDGDGLLDLTIESQVSRVLRNTGNLVFVDVTAAWIDAPLGATTTPMLHDSDGDGDVDMFDGRILWNDGAGRLTRLESYDPFFGNFSAVMQAADLDNDGHLDLLGFSDYHNATWWRGDGFGHVTEARTLNVSSNENDRSLTPFDADGDGDTDILLNSSYQLRLLRNNGMGTFVDDTAVALPVDPRRSAGVEVGDFDRDGDVDLLIGRGYSPLSPTPQDSYYQNDGTGRFVDVGPARFVDPLNTSDFAVADFDGDGDLDVATGSAPTLLFDNDGAGTFVNVTASRMPAINGTQLIATDVDGDGDPDLVAVAWPTTSLLRNDQGVFTDISGQMPPLADPRWPLAGDIDADGDLDLRIGSALLVNDGAGTFTVAGTPLSSGHDFYRRDNGLIDFDGDGDADSIGGGIAYSMYRQLELALPPRVGFHGELRLHASASVPGFTPIAALLLATRLAPVPISLGVYGTWRLDPAATFVHTSHAISAATGNAMVRFLVPNHPSMLGVSLFAQAVTANGPLSTDWRSGNAVRLEIRR